MVGERGFQRWSEGLPCGVCANHWQSYIAENPPNFSSPHSFFEWGYEAHDFVSREYSGAERLTLDEAYSIYWPQPYAERSFPLPAVTALSRLPNHYQVQSDCLDSWRRYGLEIVAVNTGEEIAELQTRYPQVDRWIESNQTSVDYPYSTQRIKRLADVSQELQKPILLLNSDIEIRGRQAQLKRYLRSGEVAIGIRWNHHGVYSRNASEFRWGFDAMSISPEQARLLPEDMPLAIGQPMWDYALPIIFMRHGVPLRFIHERLFWHREHAVNWKNHSWEFGADWVRRRYKWPLTHGRTFRASLEPELEYDGTKYVDGEGRRPWESALCPSA